MRLIQLFAGAVLALSSSVTLANSCVFTTPAGRLIDFGDYLSGVGDVSTATGDLTGQADIQIQCTKTSLLAFTYRIFIDEGGEPDIGLRKLRKENSSSFLNYNMYTDSARTLIWDSQERPSTGTSFGVGSCATAMCNRTFTVYGLIPGRQGVRSGEYSDDVLIQVNF
jgi:spore coat protein U-like protein